MRTLKAPTAPGCRAAYLIAAELLHFPKRTNGPASEDPGFDRGGSWPTDGDREFVRKFERHLAEQPQPAEATSA